MQDLKVTIVQSNLFWGDIDANLTKLGSLLNGLTESTDLIVLPEMFSTAFAVEDVKLAEQTEGKAFQWMHSFASKKNSAVVGSVFVKEKELFYNKLIFVKPDGTYHCYNKRHLFRLAGENKKFTSGVERLIVEWKGWKILPLVCYDLRFPVWSKNRYLNNSYEYDCILYLANWPGRRNFAWKSLLVARAIENQAYVVGVNRIGEDGNNIPHCGDSAILSFKGRPLLAAKSDEQVVETAVLSYDSLNSFREDFTVGMDWDRFDIVI